MLKLIVVTFLILASKIRTAPPIEYSTDEESRHESQNSSPAAISNDSPVSVAFISDSPDLSTGHKLINPSKLRINLEALGRDLILAIGEYLEFPHSTLGQLNREFKNIFENISPSQIIANQLKFPELKIFPKSFDLKYLTALKGSALNDERLLAVIVDVAFLKRLPNIKVALLRLFYARLKNLRTIGDDVLFKFIHPFQQFQHSTMSSLFVAFFEAGDFDLVFDILERYPGIILENSEIIFAHKFIESAGKMDKLGSLYEIFSRNGLISMQNKFDFVCRCLGITLNHVILNLFLSEAFHPHETWHENYSLKFLDAWIFALTHFADNFVLGDGENFCAELKLNQKMDEIRNWSVQVAIRKQTLLLLLAIRSDHQNCHEQVQDFGSNFALDPFTKRFYEEILWALNFSVIDSPKLRLAIAKSNCNEFITEIIDKFNVRVLFSSGIVHYEAEAIYNKNLLFALTGHEDELNYLYDSFMDENVFKYAMEHFKTLEHWDRFFTINDFWKGFQFSQFLQFLLNNHRKVQVFEFILTLLHEKNLRLDLWGCPVIHLSIESAEFLLQNSILRDFMIHLNYSLCFGFECLPMWAVANMRIHSLCNVLRDNVVRVKGPIDLQRLEKFLFTHKVRLIIE